MPANFTTQPTANSLPVNSKSLTDTSVNIFIGFCLIMPIIIFLGFNTYKKYRAAVRRQEIATLEKQWLLDIKKKNV
ncbi:hypothetical protein Cylst_5721 [Cylindrospermum stagnale PCC 7417]|uniref:Uncharacterized protein n=1 Tax=Cylindrospermum stagnale PCC 7417 TaxID=56107 RepID=K9X7T4_9NOST|nr:hypothetical protein [Cylindrospermum stagnale]AFZ27717.1 hypothetical protein Cylst_5721 [Cylindrospermum stagnale PCC 7417]